jgi:hypothetical protein
MNQSEMSRAVGKLEGRVEGVEERLKRDEELNHEDHKKLVVQVEVSNKEVLDAIEKMSSRFDLRITKLEDAVSISKAWFRAVKLTGSALILVLAWKFGDARDLFKDAWGALTR